jgi:hypothetical protein
MHILRLAYYRYSADRSAMMIHAHVHMYMRVKEPAYVIAPDIRQGHQDVSSERAADGRWHASQGSQDHILECCGAGLLGYFCAVSSIAYTLALDIC